MKTNCVANQKPKLLSIALYTNVCYNKFCQIPISVFLNTVYLLHSQSKRIFSQKYYLSLRFNELLDALNQGYFEGVLGTRFGSLEFQIGSLESEKNITGSLKSEKIGSLETQKSGPYRYIPGTSHFPEKKNLLLFMKHLPRHLPTFASPFLIDS